MRRPGRLGRTAAAALAAALGAAGCGGEPEALVLVGTVERTLIELTAPRSEVIVRVPVERGEHVAEGQEVVRLDSLLAEAELAAAQAVVARAESAVLVAQHDWERIRSLHADQVASEQRLEQARLARDEAEAGLREAVARLAAAGKHVSDLVVRAPADGVVDQIPFDRGERVPAGAVVAVLLADGEPWVRVWIPERAQALVGPGTPASVHLDGVPGPLPGVVRDVNREPEFTPHFALTERERVHLVYEARVALPEAPDGLRPGAPAEVRLALPGSGDDGPTP